MAISKTTLAGICVAISGVLGSGTLVDMPPAAKPWLMVASSIFAAIGLFLAADAKAAPALPPAPEPTAESIVAEARAKAAADKAAGK